MGPTRAAITPVVAAPCLARRDVGRSVARLATERPGFGTQKTVSDVATGARGRARQAPALKSAKKARCWAAQQQRAALRRLPKKKTGCF